MPAETSENKELLRPCGPAGVWFSELDRVRE